MTEQCLSYFFGMCVQSEADAREMILMWGIGSAVGLAAIITVAASTLVGAQASLKFIRIAALCAGFAAGGSLLLAYADVLFVHELKQLIVGYGYQIAMALLAVSFTARWFGKRLESTEPETLRRDAVVCGSAGSFLIIGCAFAAVVPSVWSELFFLFFTSVLLTGLIFLGVAWWFWSQGKSHLTA